MKLNEIRDNDGSRQARKRVGRGIASGTGKTSGKGMKGQKSRSGVSLLGTEGGQMPLYRRLPKRGFTNARFAKDVAELTLGRLQEAIDNKKVDAKKPITTAILQDAGLVKRAKDGVKLLATGEIKAKVTLELEGATKGAVAAIEKAGGTVTIAAPKADAEGADKKAAKKKDAKKDAAPAADA